MRKIVVYLNDKILEGKESHSGAVLEEIADVHIMLMQMTADEEDEEFVDKIIRQKLDRQLRRIEAEKEENKICKYCRWYKGPFARIGLCSYSKSELYDNYVDDDMACGKWED